MERCVNVEPYYTELLDMIVASLRDMQPLPATKPTTFSAARDAFRYDWRSHFGKGAASVTAAAPASGVSLVPQPLSDVVVTYITNLPFTPEPQAVPFADVLIAEPLLGAAVPTAPVLQSLIADVGKAGTDEGFHVFHAAVDRTLPNSSLRLVGRLATLSQAHVMTALVVDGERWPVDTTWFASAIASPDWIGPVFVSGKQAELTKSDAAFDAPGANRTCAAGCELPV
jgi:hypothetical protein